MQDKLEEFIEKHRNEFDVHEPPMRLWNGINKQLPEQKKRRPSFRYLLAASILLLIGISAGFFLQRGGEQKEVPQAMVTTVALKPEIKEAEHYYTTMVAASLNQLDQYGSDYPELCRNFKTEIDTLNVIYGQLKVEYSNSMGNEAVLQAMVENLQKQVSLIQMQMQVIRDLKQNKEVNHNRKIKFT